MAIRCSANKLHSVKPHLGYCSVTHLSRRDAAILRRLRIGHTRVTHKYLLSGDSQPLDNQSNISHWTAVVWRMSVKTTSSAAHLKNYLRLLMQQQSWILSKKLVFTMLYSVICLSFFLPRDAL